MSKTGLPLQRCCLFRDPAIFSATRTAFFRDFWGFLRALCGSRFMLVPQVGVRSLDANLGAATTGANPGFSAISAAFLRYFCV